MSHEMKKKLLLAILVAAFGITSFTVLLRYATSTASHQKTIEALDEKKNTVMELTAASTAASALLSMIPGDAGTPIANKFADLSGYFLIVVSAIFLEKYLLTLTGYAAFMILIPLACVVLLIHIFRPQDSLKQLALKLILFALAIYLVIPSSIKASSIIETTYKVSYEDTIHSLNESSEEIDEDTKVDETSSEKKDKGFFSGLADKVSDGISNVADSITGISTDAIKKMEGKLNQLIEALAVMLITSCVIPILVLCFFLWVIKVILGIQIKVRVPKLSKLKEGR